MKTYKRNSLTPVAGAIAAALYPGSSAVAQDAEAPEADNYALEEVIVTATKRAVSVQDIPASVQAITQETLAAMGAKTMEDYARFVPSMNMVNYGSSSSMIVFRGATSGDGWLTQSTSSVYLDEISITQVGAQPGHIVWLGRPGRYLAYHHESTGHERVRGRFRRRASKRQ